MGFGWRICGGGILLSSVFQHCAFGSELHTGFFCRKLDRFRLKGIVFKSTGSWYKVQIGEGQFWQCRLKGKIKLTKTGVNNPIAVGDVVEVEPEAGQPGQGIISEILPRENYIIRKSVHRSSDAHILASNLDQVLVIASITHPRTSLGFVDRLLVSAESFQIPAKVIFNKIDLLDDEEKQFALDLATMYSSIGYPSICTSVPESLNLGTVDAWLSGKRTLLAGHSGVGKSSIINALIPGMELATQEISTFANKGKHTTTYAEMYEIEPGTYLIDTPGIKELGLLEMEDENLSIYFPEMRPFSAKCRFYNCTHRHEPGCEVQKGVDGGLIPLTRYESYVSMMTGDDNRR